MNQKKIKTIVMTFIGFDNKQSKISCNAKDFQQYLPKIIEHIGKRGYKIPWDDHD